MNVFTVFTVLGGIALFLFGMEMMSDGLQKAAGTKMRHILEMFTRNRFVGLLVGFFITAVIQSSSATTAMTVSFVNAGLMQLSQSVGVIFGANIGTTITGQLMAFKFEEFAPIIVAISLVCYMFVKNQRIKKIGYIILGFGILFLGMGMMKDAMEVMSESQAITDTLTSISNPVLLLFFGIVVTAIIQSSSAMVGILIGLASTGLMTVDACFFVILGSNIGACVTAMIASLNANREAKRAAWIHLLFNIIVTVILFVIMLVIPDPVTKFIYAISPGGTDADIASRAVAMANSVFRIFGAVILFPFGKQLVQLTRIIIPVKPEESREAAEGKLQFIGPHAMVTATSALAAMGKELERYAHMSMANLKLAVESLMERDKRKIAAVTRTEDNIDILCKEMQDYMVKVTQMQIPMEEEYKVSGYFHVINDIERIGDHAQNIAELADKCINENIVFSDIAMGEIGRMYVSVNTNIEASMEIFVNEKYDLIPEVLKREEEIDRMEKEFQAEHVERLTRHECSPKSGIFTDVLANLERIGDHADNIAISIVPEKKLYELTGRSKVDL